MWPACLLTCDLQVPLVLQPTVFDIAAFKELHWCSMLWLVAAAAASTKFCNTLLNRKMRRPFCWCVQTSLLVCANLLVCKHRVVDGLRKPFVCVGVGVQGSGRP